MPGGQKTLKLARSESPETKNALGFIRFSASLKSFLKLTLYLGNIAFQLPSFLASRLFQSHFASEIKNPPANIIKAPVRRIPWCFSFRK